MKPNNFEKTASLAKLNFNPSERVSFEQEFSNMIKFADMLTEAEVIESSSCHECILREDVHEEEFSEKIMLSNAPVVSDNYISVPKVL